jgi:hypothetical protein
MTKCVSREWLISDDQLEREKIGYFTGWVTYAAEGTDKVRITFNVPDGDAGAYAGTSSNPVKMEAALWEWFGDESNPVHMANKFQKIQSNIFTFPPNYLQVTGTATIPADTSIDDIVVFHRGVEVDIPSQKVLGSLMYSLQYFVFYINWYTCTRGQQATTRIDKVYGEAVSFSGSNWKVWRAHGLVPLSENNLDYNYYNTQSTAVPSDVLDHSWLYTQRNTASNSKVANRTVLMTQNTPVGSIKFRAAKGAETNSLNTGWSNIIYNQSLFTSFYDNSWGNDSKKIPSTPPISNDSVQTKEVTLFTGKTEMAKDYIEVDTSFSVDGAHGYIGAAEFNQKIEWSNNNLFVKYTRGLSYREYSAGDDLEDTHWSVSAVLLPYDQTWPDLRENYAETYGMDINNGDINFLSKSSNIEVGGDKYGYNTVLLNWDTFASTIRIRNLNCVGEKRFDYENYPFDKPTTLTLKDGAVVGDLRVMDKSTLKLSATELIGSVRLYDKSSLEITFSENSCGSYPFINGSEVTSFGASGEIKPKSSSNPGGKWEKEQLTTISWKVPVPNSAACYENRIILYDYRDQEDGEDLPIKFSEIT